MLMYVVRSMNLWASTDMRLTISPTVEDFLAELVITRACGTKERKKVSVAGEEPALRSSPLRRKEAAQEWKGNNCSFLLLC